MLDFKFNWMMLRNVLDLNVEGVLDSFRKIYLCLLVIVDVELVCDWLLACFEHEMNLLWRRFRLIVLL